MSSGADQPPLRFLFDEHVNVPAMEQLQARGVDVVHVRDVGLLRSDDAVILDWARREGRIIITRNYQDFAPLVEQAARQQVRFPGVLFCPQSLAHSDVGGHVCAVEAWLARAREAGTNPAEGTFGWL